MTDSTFVVFVLAVLLSYVYAFISGFTDAANAIATSVGTRALKPAHAVIGAGILELLGALTGTAVAMTIGSGIIARDALTQSGVVAALLGAMTWSLLTYVRGIPVSETHGLIGAIISVGLFDVGPEAVEWASLLKVFAAILISPALGAAGAVGLTSLIYHAARRAARGRTVRQFRNLQRLSAAYMAFSHGRNDAQKPMGVLAMAVAVHTGTPTIDVPVWIIISVGAVAGLGVAMGGWRIIRTIGMKMTGLTVEQGFAAEASAATVLQLASTVGVPVSTTQAIAAAIVGAGTTRGRKAVRWDVVGEIALSWVLTLPATTILGYAMAFIVRTLMD